ncbi:Uncharacterized protein dnm_017740 [Desulfonema magnum]|uniref:Uncharacterized protein n=1 Tax=Desulfonema magnum TaxID=45655 RepID=A0A975BI60_9BACT|nr:Uncharacterized protein dnm_017740 [Desulfonema magnum]
MNPCTWHWFRSMGKLVKTDGYMNRPKVGQTAVFSNKFDKFP